MDTKFFLNSGIVWLYLSAKSVSYATWNLCLLNISHKKYLFFHAFLLSFFSPSLISVFNLLQIYWVQNYILEVSRTIYILKEFSFRIPIIDSVSPMIASILVSLLCDCFFLWRTKFQIVYAMLWICVYWVNHWW